MRKPAYPLEDFSSGGWLNMIHVESSWGGGGGGGGYVRCVYGEMCVCEVCMCVRGWSSIEY